MKHYIEFECGETTCISGKGNKCRFVFTTHFGTVSRCAAFGHILEDKYGWLLRCGECRMIAKSKGENE